MSELRVERLIKRFGGVLVFHDVSFRLAPGDILGVIGPNGAGKTTLINVIAGRIAPSGGRVFLGDREVTGQPSHALSRLGVGRSFQQTNTFRSVSVRENIARAIRFGARGAAAGLDTIAARFRIGRPVGRTERQTALWVAEDAGPADGIRHRTERAAAG